MLYDSLFGIRLDGIFTFRTPVPGSLRDVSFCGHRLGFVRGMLMVKGFRVGVFTPPTQAWNQHPVLGLGVAHFTSNL